MRNVAEGEVFKYKGRPVKKVGNRRIRYMDTDVEETLSWLDCCDLVVLWDVLVDGYYITDEHIEPVVSDPVTVDECPAEDELVNANVEP